MSDSLRVAVCWWAPGAAPGGRTQAIRGNTRGFRQAGHDVDLWYKDQVEDEMPDDEYDLILSPFLDVYWPDDSAHVHLQLGGFGPPSLDDEAVVQVISSADSVSVLDTWLAYHYAERVGLDPADAAVIPNPPNADLFGEQPWEFSTGRALIPKVGGPYKRPDRATAIASQVGDVTFWTHTAQNVALAPNIYPAPPVPLTAMPTEYGRAEVVVNPASQEGLPNVAFEAFLSGRPYIATREATGEIQLLPASAVDTSMFGATAEWWRDLATVHVYGDHLVATDDEQFPQAVETLMNDRDRRQQVGARGREWVVEAFDVTDEGAGWGWQEKAACIVTETFADSL